MLIGERGGDTRSFDTGNISQFDRRGSNDGSGIPGTYDRITITSLHEIHRDTNGRIFLLSDGLHRRIVHRNDLGSMHDLDFAVGVGQILELLLDDRFVTYQKELLEIAAKRLESLNGPHHDRFGKNMQPEKKKVTPRE